MQKFIFFYPKKTFLKALWPLLTSNKTFSLFYFKLHWEKGTKLNMSQSSRSDQCHHLRVEKPPFFSNHLSSDFINASLFLIPFLLPFCEHEKKYNGPSNFTLQTFSTKVDFFSSFSFPSSSSCDCYHWISAIKIPTSSESSFRKGQETSIFTSFARHWPCRHLLLSPLKKKRERESSLMYVQ